MQLAEAEIRPRKPLFHLATAEAILARGAGGDRRPTSRSRPAGRAALARRAAPDPGRRAQERRGRADGDRQGPPLRAEPRCRRGRDHPRRSTIFATREVYPVDNPSGAETISIAAVGGYGRGTLAPGSDIDLLFILPYKQTPWGEQVTEYILYMLWDLGQKVGHAVRSVDECLRMAKSDMTVRTATLEARYLTGDRALFDQLEQALRGRDHAQDRPRVHRRQDGRARRAPQADGQYALRGRAQRQGRQGRAARPQHAVLDRQVLLPRQDRRRAGRQGRALGRRVPPVPARRGFPLGDPLQPPLPHRPRRRQADLRPPARARRSASASPTAPACSASSG